MYIRLSFVVVVVIIYGLVFVSMLVNTATY